MNKLLKNSLFAALSVGILGSFTTIEKPLSTGDVLFHDVTLIDGNGGTPLSHMDIMIKNGLISGIAQHIDANGAKVINLKGKTLMPALISTHVHIGILKGTGNKAENYTRENILAQLSKYEDYGVGTILSMGTDRPLIYKTGLLDSSAHSLLPGARMHAAGYGFGAPAGAPPMEMGMDHVYRPSSADQVPAMMDTVAALKPDVVKLWLDDFSGKFKKMKPEIYTAIIREAHQHQLRVVAHAYYLSDARKLVAAGIDVIGHSVRDSVIDDALVQEMKAKHVAYIPTLSLDEYAYIYARKPDWINDPFFKASLEPGVYEMITSAKYQQDLKNSPAYARNAAAFETALKNLKKLYDAGVLISLGTDSGALPVRAQGFSEHLELELMVQAGLTPIQAIGIATKNAAQLLNINNLYGTVEKGKVADFLILSASPEKDIKNTRKIEAVYKAGEQVSKGPLK